MGGSTGDGLSRLREARERNLRKASEHMQRQGQELGRTVEANVHGSIDNTCLLYTSPSPRDS